MQAVLAVCFVAPTICSRGLVYLPPCGFSRLQYLFPNQLSNEFHTDLKREPNTWLPGMIPMVDFPKGVFMEPLNKSLLEFLNRMQC